MEFVYHCFKTELLTSRDLWEVGTNMYVFQNNTCSSSAVPKFVFPG